MLMDAQYWPVSRCMEALSSNAQLLSCTLVRCWDMLIGSEQHDHLMSNCQGSTPEGISSLQPMSADRLTGEEPPRLSKSTCRLPQACGSSAPQPFSMEP